MPQRLVLFIVFLGVLAAACGEDSPVSIDISIDFDAEVFREQTSEWVESIGAENADPDVWRDRLERACGEGVWDLEVAKDLATEFVTEDLSEVSTGVPIDPATAVDAAETLRDMARDACPERFPGD